MKADKSLTKREKAAIKALDRLAKRWPDSLALLSWSGSLVVVPTDEMDEPREKRCIPISGITNDGGDPNPYLDDDDLADWDDWDLDDRYLLTPPSPEDYDVPASPEGGEQRG